jgi:serine/threonine protein kinase
MMQGTREPVATYSRWIELGRQVRKGSKAKVVLAPVMVGRESKDANGNIVIGGDGKPCKRQILVGFRDSRTVFGYSDGDELDFGIAEAKGDTHLTMAGYQVGSFDYMAPERFGDEEATPAVDVYSLACVLDEALTGAKPFPVHSAEQAIGAHMSSPPPRPSAVNACVPASFDGVIGRGMAKHPDDRYGSAGALGRRKARTFRTTACPTRRRNIACSPTHKCAC